MYTKMRGAGNTKMKGGNKRAVPEAPRVRNDENLKTMLAPGGFTKHATVLSVSIRPL
jgi:hypothetical protein